VLRVRASCRQEYSAQLPGGLSHRAIHFGDIHDPGSKVAELLATREHKVLSESVGAKPQIYYLEP
jgi:Fe-S-cluster-containing dehydrogenase component